MRRSILMVVIFFLAAALTVVIYDRSRSAAEQEQEAVTTDDAVPKVAATEAVTPKDAAAEVVTGEIVFGKLDPSLVSELIHYNFDETRVSIRDRDTIQIVLEELQGHSYAEMENEELEGAALNEIRTADSTITFGFHDGDIFITGGRYYRLTDGELSPRVRKFLEKGTIYDRGSRSSIGRTTSSLRKAHIHTCKTGDLWECAFRSEA